MGGRVPSYEQRTLTMCSNLRQNKWKHVVVIGGKSEHGSHMYDVQFLNTATKSWYSLTPLPQSPHIPSATLCGNTLYVIGNIGKADSSSIQSLTCYNDDESNPPPASLVWKALPPPPVIHSAILHHSVDS